jgi:hypothetical protein
VFSSLQNRKETNLPNKFNFGHKLSFLLHDIMTSLFETAKQTNMFSINIDIYEDEYKKFLENSEDIGKWILNTKEKNKSAKVLKTIVFPAVLSDMLHCFYEALETSRKGKLTISYMLIRKPLQESLYLLEEIVLSELSFSDKLINNLNLLESSSAGGIDGHTKRIEKIFEIIGSNFGLSPQYITKLRYDKSNEDSFDGICNKAMHLFTNSKYIKTENMNINMIFSGYSEFETQWAYLYSRLPYLLFYTWIIVEYLTNSIIETSQEYLDDIRRRVSALIILWWNEIDDFYKNEKLESFVGFQEEWLNNHCLKNGYEIPTKNNLIKMFKNGSFPNENKNSIKQRLNRYQDIYKINLLDAKYYEKDVNFKIIENNKVQK